jgi:hypothetical protein
MLAQAKHLPTVPDNIKRTIFKINAGKMISKMTILEVDDTDFEKMAQFIANLPAFKIGQFQVRDRPFPTLCT